MQRTAPAKINLYLHITGKRADGYHQLETLVVFADAGDVLRVTPSESLTLTVTGEFSAEAGSGAENLVLRAAEALRAATGIRAGAALALEKNLPVGAGLGGGSADAAAALKLLMNHWAVILPEAQLMKIASALGADVPICLAGAPLIARGAGEEISLPAAPLPELSLVLVYPRTPLATKDVFARYRMERQIATPALDFSSAEKFRMSLAPARNQLQPVAISLLPEVAEVLLALETAPQARLVRMTGSGSACFAITDDAENAHHLAQYLTQRYPHWWVRAIRTA
jgi:4-diphosphocytidyl-2-C-methyl-D-erythritol kinase